MNPDQTLLHGRAYASPVGVLPSLPDDTVAVVLPALNMHKLRDPLGGRLP